MQKLQTLDALIDRLDRYGDKTALVALRRQDAERWSYGELAELATRLARGLIVHGLNQSDRVALLAENSPAWIIACLAVIRAGAVVVPLDVQLNKDTLARILDDSAPRLIFTTSARSEALEVLELESKPQRFLLDAKEDDERSWRQLMSDQEIELPALKTETTATLFYTSGTTGPPKGVPLSHGNLVFQINTLEEAELVGENDRVLLPLPLHHVYPFVVGMLVPLALGLPLVLPYSRTGPQLVRALKEGEVTLILGVPRLYDALYAGIQAQASQNRLGALIFKTALRLSLALRQRFGLRLGRQLFHPLHRRFAPHLRVTASGGSALDPELGWKLEALGWRVGIGYGLTETAPLIAINPPGNARFEAVGRPAPGVEVRIDTEAGGEAEKSGEILVRGPNVFSGYRKLPDKTEEAFTADGWFRTGDLGYLDQEGYLYVTGRVSTLIVTPGGENVQPDQVEEAYAKSPIIAEIGVLQDDDRLVAAIVPDIKAIQQRENGDVEQAVRDTVAERSKVLPSYQRIADYAITRESLPRTRLGKIRRHELEDRYRQAKEGRKETEARAPISIEEMPASDRELLDDPAVREVWEVLAERYADRRLTPDTSPQLDLGIDSLEWLNLTLEIRSRARIELDEEAIARIETVRDLLREAVEAGETDEPESAPLDEPEKVLSDLQKGWLRPMGPLQAALSRALFALNRLLVRVLFRLQVEGLDRVPIQDAFVLTPNHLSLLDPFAVAAALDHSRLQRIYWGGATLWAFGNPLTRAVSRLTRTVPIDPERAAVSSLAFGAAVLKRNHSLVWFPEGGRSPDGKLQPFKPGLGMLLERFPTTVVPVRISGSFAALPPGHWLPRLNKIAVRFGEPLDPRELAHEGEAEEASQRITTALHDRVAELENLEGEER